jgi:hypothetical protein
VPFESVMARQSTVVPGFRKPLFPIPNPFDHLRKIGAMMQKATVSHGKTKMDKKVRLRVSVRSSSKIVFYRGRGVGNAMSMEF